jgi:hypothetical protein
MKYVSLLSLLISCSLCANELPLHSIRGHVDALQILEEEGLIGKGYSSSVDMYPVMQEIEQYLPSLLQDRDSWKSLFIDYQKPYLMRIYRDIESSTLKATVRVSLHYFLPDASPQNEEGEFLYHPHAWASSMRILEGMYSQFHGFANQRGLAPPPAKLCNTIHIQGDSYAMNHPWLWHEVNPFPNQAVMTLMVTYMPAFWDQDAPQSSKKLRSLNEEELQFMFTEFRRVLEKIN